MLDAFEILTPSGIVLWRRHYAPISSNIINSLINDRFIEERQAPSAARKETGDVSASYRKDKYTLKWTTARLSEGVGSIGLVFVAVYQSLLHLSWVENLLTAVKALFVKQYGERLKQPHTTKIDCAGFDATFDALVRKLDTGSAQQRRQSDGRTDDSEGPTQLTPPSSSASATEGAEDAVDEPPPPPVVKSQFKKPGAPASASREQPVFDDTTSTDVTPVPTPDTSRPSTPSQAKSQLLTAKAGPGKSSRRARKAGTSAFASAPASSGDESDRRRPKSGKTGVKAKRRWDASGVALEDEDDGVLDYSATSQPHEATDGDRDREADAGMNEVRAEEMGSRTGKGQFVLKDLDDEVDAIIASSKQQTQTQPTRRPTTAFNTTDDESEGGLLNSATSKLSSLFRNVVGGKTLSKEDLRQPLQQMENHLVSRNVAREAAVRLCKSVETDLLESKTANFTSIDATIRASMAKALTRMLTPTSSLDLLRSINTTISGEIASPSKSAGGAARPYVISIVGVNGVGKSTNLSKIAYFLLQNRYRVLVVAADTFRSGAVEQLRVHVNRLSELSRREEVGTVELFEKGYGKDAATVARDAVSYASQPSETRPTDAKDGASSMRFDVVLIDTAGRRHNDSRLMSSLTKFGQLANPDKVFMVGEALVGTDSVAQARNFAKEFVDAKGQLRNGGLGLDGFIISKCDTVGDMVGTLVSMVHATGIPVVFLGVGQHYGDLRGLNVGWAVERLMR